MIKRFFQRIEHFFHVITTHPKLTIGICLLIVALFAMQLPKLTFDSDMKKYFPADFPAKIALDDLEEIFGGSEVVMIGIETDTIYNQDVLATIQRLSEEIEAFDEVDKVTSLFTVSDIVGTEEGMEVNDLIEAIPETAEAMNALRGRIRANDLFWNNIVSDDETTTAIVATIVPDATDAAIHDKLQAILARETANQEHIKFYLGGMPVVRASITVSMQHDMLTFLPAGLLLMILLLYVSFRSLRGVLLPFGVVLMSMICTFGLMALLGKPITMLGVLLPAMLIAIANDYSIHIVARYYEDVTAHVDYLTPQKIVHDVFRRLGIPILLAGVTTVAGFASLLSHIIPPAQDLGLMASFGITLAFLFSMTFVPAWLALLPIPKILAEGRRRELLDILLQNLTRLLTRNPSTSKALVVTGLCIAVVFAFGIPKIVVDTNEINNYEADHPLVVSANLLNAKLGGSTTIDVVFEGDIQDPAVLHKIQDVQEYMNSLPFIGKTISMVDHLKMMNKAMHEDDPAYYTIPETRELVAQYLLLYSMSGDPEDFDEVVDYEYRKAHLTGRITESGTREIADIVKQIERYVDGHFDAVTTPTVQSVTGFSALFSELVELIVWGQVRSLLLSLVFVFLLGAVVFRSVIGGLFTVYPVSIAMMTVFGLMGYFDITLNIATAMLSSILIGVGVDYTIHFLYHYREAVQHDGVAPHNALEVTLMTSGKGIIYNALSVVVGFCVLMLSNFQPIYFFGWLLTFSILTCLIGALTLLPAAVFMFKPRFIFPGSQQDSEQQIVAVNTNLNVENM